MKNKILGLFMTLAFIFTVGISNVSAAVLTVNEVYNILFENLGDSVQLNDNIINIKETSEDGFEYTMDLKYENNILTYTNTRDVTNMTQDYRVSYAMCDNIMVLAIVYGLLDSYGIEDFSSINWEEFGITLVEGEKVSYEGKSDITVEESNDPEIKLEISGNNSIDVTLSSSEIKIFSIDMVKFDEAAIKYNSNNTSTEETKTDVVTENKKEDTTIEKNPQTGLKDMGLGILVVGLISLISYLLIKKKKIFVK